MPEPTPTGPSRATRIAAVRAFLAGRAAKRRGEPIDVCPFDLDAVAEDGADPVVAAEAAIERLSARYWLKGWTRS